MTYTIQCIPEDWPLRVARLAWGWVKAMFVLAPWIWFFATEGWREFL